MGVGLMKEDVTMKKVFAILMLAATLAACTREELPQVIDQPETPATCTLSISASKGEETRALELSNDGKTLNAIWDAEDEVYVFLNDELTHYVAILRPESSSIYPDKESCTLTGSFTVVPQAEDVLTLKLTSNNYSGQKGTLDYIARWCDYAVATMTVTGVHDGQIESVEGVASFESRQAIVKFTLKDKADNAVISPSALTVTDGVRSVSLNNIPSSTYTTNGAGVLYVAFPATGSPKTITLVATVGDDTYTLKKSGVTFTNGQYYAITAKMTRNAESFNLSDESIYVNGLFTAQDGCVLTGTFPDGYGQRIRIADGATVTLRNMTINNTSTRYAGIGLDGSATLILEGENTVSASSHHAGILLGGAGSTLTILGSGSLTAKGGYGAAGIGCSDTGSDCGAVTICGGTVTATGGTGAAGIGCSVANISCGAITISDPARVTATKGWGAPYSIGPSNNGHCESVTIYGELYWDGSTSYHNDVFGVDPLVIPFS